MNRTITSLIALAIVAPTHAFAEENPWGTPEDAEKCIKELTKGEKEFVNGSWVTFKKDKSVQTPDNASAACKAEVDKRADACLKDPAMEKELKAPRGKHAVIIKSAGADGPRLVCADEGWWRIKAQHDKILADKQAAERKKAEDEQRKEAAAKAELPKPGKKDAALEKQIAATYSKAYPDAKVLKVIIIDKDWSTERNNFGVIIGRNIQAAVIDQPKGETELCEVYNELWQQEYIGGHFKSAVVERGAGSLQRSDIICSKVK